MAPTPVPFPLSSRPGAFAEEGQGRLVNCWAEKDGDATFWRRLPGATPFGDLGDPAARGALPTGSGALVATGKMVVSLNGDGTVVAMSGTLPGIGPVTMARNNKAPLFDTVVVTSTGAFVVDQSAQVIRPYSPGVATNLFTPFTDMPQPNSVSFLDGYFLFTTAGGLIVASQQNSTDASALSFNKDQPPSHPGGLLRGVVSGQQFFAFGPDNTEVYQDAGTSPFPLSRLSVIPIGLLSPWAVAGFEDGWSGEMIFVASDGTVRALDGYTPTRISTPDVERAIRSVTAPTDLKARVYTFSGNAIWSLSAPGFTWEYNVTQGQWHERASQGLTRWRGDVTVRAFNRWLVTDLLSSAIGTIDQDGQTDFGAPLIWGADSGAVKAFPQRLRVPACFLDFVVGQGIAAASDPDDQDPEVQVSWSHDGGNTWGRPVLRPLGRQGDYRASATVNRMGVTTQAGIRVRFRISTPRPGSFLGAAFDDVDARRA